MKSKYYTPWIWLAIPALATAILVTWHTVHPLPQPGGSLPVANPQVAHTPTPTSKPLPPGIDSFPLDHMQQQLDSVGIEFGVGEGKSTDESIALSISEDEARTQLASKLAVKTLEGAYILKSDTRFDEKTKTYTTLSVAVIAKKQ